MPTYEYQCAQCGHKAEAFQKITEEPLKQCPSCKTESYQRRPGRGVGLSFVGSGFYKTDYNTHQNHLLAAPAAKIKAFVAPSIRDERDTRDHRDHRDKFLASLWSLASFFSLLIVV